MCLGEQAEYVTYLLRLNLLKKQLEDGGLGDEDLKLAKLLNVTLVGRRGGRSSTSRQRVSCWH